MELVLEDALAHELMARVEAAGVADHGDEPGLLLRRDHRFRVLQAVGERNLDLHMLAGLEALKRLRGVHLRRRGQDDRVEPRKLQGVGEIGRDMADAIFRRRLLGLVELAPDERDRLDPVDLLDRVEVFQAEGAGAGKRDFEGLGHAKPRLSACLVIPDGREADDRESRADNRAGLMDSRSDLRSAGNDKDLKRYAAFSRMRCPTAVLDAGT